MTPNKEDYIKELYHLGGVENLVGNKKISETLKVSPASVTEMLGKLSREGLIRYEPYKGSQLTQDGLKIAISLLRGHRLWEVFLIQHLEYSWSEAHEDAELLEHISPTRLIKRLDKFLNYPVHCPHGNVIPRPDEKVKMEKFITLCQLSKGDRAYVRKVKEEKELMDYLQQLGVNIGDIVTVNEVGAYEGPFILQLNGKKIQISYKAACKIYVQLKQP